VHADRAGDADVRLGRAASATAEEVMLALLALTVTPPAVIVPFRISATELERVMPTATPTPSATLWKRTYPPAPGLLCTSRSVQRRSGHCEGVGAVGLLISVCWV
jgi:hypothetical protein